MASSILKFPKQNNQKLNKTINMADRPQGIGILPGIQGRLRPASLESRRVLDARTVLAIILRRATREQHTWQRGAKHGEHFGAI